MISKLVMAAGAIALSASAVSAADLNKPAKVAVDYVKVCDAYGAGFFYIPGSDTCLRLTGYIYTGYEYGVSNTISNAAANGVGGLSNIKGQVYAGGLLGGQRGRNQTDTYIRADVQYDARTKTEYGLLRSYVNFHTDFNTSNSNTSITTVRLDDAIVQFGGLFAGRTFSLFQAIKSHYVIQQNWGDVYMQGRTNQLGYNFDFGNGVTANIDVEDPTTTGYIATNNGSDSYPRHNGQSFAYGALNAPDILASLKINQAWGSAEIDGLAHQLYGGVTTPVTAWGYGIGGNVRFQLPQIAKGDSVMFNFNYTSGSVAMADWTAFQFKPAAGFTDLGADATYSAATGLKRTSALSFDVGAEHNFSPNFKVDVSAGVLFVNGYAQTTGAAALANGGYGGNSFTQTEQSINFYWMPAASIPSTFIVPYVEARQITFTNQTKANYAAAALANGSAVNFGLRVNSGF
jgi:hypothetical protein